MKNERQNPKLGIVLLPGYDDWRGQSVHEHLKLARASESRFLVGLDAKRFGDGEATVMFKGGEPTVRGKNLVFLADVTNHESAYQMHGRENRRSPDDHFADLKSAINSASGKSNYGTTVVMPYLYRGREDKRAQRGGLDCARGLQELERLGVEHFITVDAHAPTVQNAIPNRSFDNILPTYPMVKAILDDEYQEFNDKNMMTIGPDVGSAGRTSTYASILGSPMGLFHKERDFETFENGKHPVKNHVYTGSSVEGKTSIIFDDIIASGGTIIETAARLKEMGAKSVLVSVTHGLFNGGFKGFDKAVEDEIIKRVYVTNSAYIPQEGKNREWLRHVDITEEIAKTISALQSGQSLTPYVRGNDRFAELLKETRER
ncbi:MAG: ribose-phosphate diphosphokinase [Firmicutes bacterium]|nr:ribose-phosphate diphosphokinase [Bacillota bacterium]